MSTPAILYQTSAMTDCRPFGKKAYKFPLPQKSPIQLAAYAFDQDFEMRLSSFPPAQRNALSSSATFQMVEPDSNAILTSYSQPQNSGGGIGKFKATFNVVPASWDNFDTMEWTPPGWIGTPAGATAYTARNPVPKEVKVRQHFDYFVVDPNGLLPNGIMDSGGNQIVATTSTDSLINGNTAAKKVTSSSAIPDIFRTPFCNTLENSGNPPTPIYSSDTPDLSPAGGFSGVNAFYLETFPSIQAYQVWCANVAAIRAAGGNPWLAPSLVWDGGNGSRSATGVPVAPYLDQDQTKITQIILKDSVLDNFAGNIWSRMTTYALCI